jgi:ABC-type multidrug transport system fused ATPase/permease subunit
VKYVKWIWNFWQPHWPWLFILAFMTLLSGAVTLAYPMVLKSVIDGLTEAYDTGDPQLARATILHYIWILVLIGVGRSLANLYPAFRALMNAKLEMDVRDYYFGRIMGKGYRFFMRFRTGDIVTRLTDDIAGHMKIAWFSCSGIFRAVESTSKFLFSMAFMLSMDWRLALLSTIPLPLMMLIFYRVRTVLTQRSLHRQQMVSSTNDALDAAFSGVRILKAFNGEERQYTRFRDLLGERIEVEIGVVKLRMGLQSLYQGTQSIGQMIVIVVGGLMVLRGELTIGEFYAFYFYLTLLLQPLMDIPNLFVTSRTAFASIDREIELERTDDEAAVSDGRPRLPLESIRSMDLRNVSFAYGEGRPNVLDDVTLSLRGGQRIAVVGGVGAGKTTLVKLLAGLLPPDSGMVLINGAPLAEYDSSAVVSRIGYVPQEANLFSESVAENISFGRDLPDEMVEDALELARVRQEMEALPRGIKQVLGQRGLTVSGGQKQRLAIARALAAAPDLLLLDDVTSALDAENERRFWEGVRRRMPDAACVIVTHRLATARQADVIYMLERGRVICTGTHLELLQNCPQYQDFLTHEELEQAIGMTAPQPA